VTRRKRKPRAQKKIVIIAGPNGAGKTTFAKAFLPTEAGCADFVNADYIAGGLSPFAPERAAIAAGRIMLQQIASKVQAGKSFAFETTLAGLNYARHIPDWRNRGYNVKLIFLGLPSADLSVSRVRSRVGQGGHDVPEETVRRRFDAGLRNFNEIYRDLVDSWALYDNSGSKPRLLDEGDRR
jgi:predicted ABC-type ATPase